MRKVVKPEGAAGQRADRRALADIDDLIDAAAYDAASVLAWEVQRTTPGDPAVWLLLARIDYLRERFAAAMYAARMATRLDPASPEAWLALAMTAVTRPRWHTEGLDAALQATALAPQDARAWTVLSQLQLLGGAPYEAAVAAEHAVRVDPLDRGGYLMLGETALEAGELTHAEAAFRRVLELDGADPDGQMGLAEVLELRGVDPEAELTRYGKPPPRTRRGSARTGVAPRMTRAVQTASATGGLVAVVGAGTALLLGLLLGLVVPGLGLVRGLVGAVALVLMWIAIKPLRPRQPGTAGVSPADGDDQTDDDQADERVVEVDPDRVAAATLGDVSLARELATDVAAHEAINGGPSSVPPVQPRPDDRTARDAVMGADAAGAADPHPDAPADRTGDDMPDVDMPDDPAALAELSRARLAASDLELAHAAASRLEAVAPGTLEAHRALGAVAMAERDFEQARVHYRAVLDLEPLDQDAHERLALVSASAGTTGSRFPLRGFRHRR
jgi:cytochrome c-type biogenesis protein CcmH/NrfG